MLQPWPVRLIWSAHPRSLGDRADGPEWLFCAPSRGSLDLKRPAVSDAVDTPAALLILSADSKGYPYCAAMPGDGRISFSLGRYVL